MWEVWVAGLSQVLAWFYVLVPSVFSVFVMLAAVLNLVCLPLVVRQMKGSRVLTHLQPVLAGLRERHSSGSSVFNKELLRVYGSHKVNPLSPFWPLLLTFPVWVGVVSIVRDPVGLLPVGSDIRNGFLDGSAFKVFLVDYSVSAREAVPVFGWWSPHVWVPVGLAVAAALTVAATLWVRARADEGAAPARRVLVVAVGVAALYIFLPAGVALFWVVSNLFRLLSIWYATSRLGPVGECPAADHVCVTGQVNSGVSG